MTALVTETSTDLEDRLGLESGALGTALIDLLGRVSVGLCIHEAVNGRCLFANETLANLMRRKPAQIVGHGLADWLDPAVPVISQSMSGQPAPNSVSSDGPLSLWLTVNGDVRHFSIYQQALSAVDHASPRLFCSVWLETDCGSSDGRAGVTSHDPPDCVEWSSKLVPPECEDASPKNKADIDRGLFDARCQSEIEACQQHARECSLLSVGIDDLAASNDCSGRPFDGMVADAMERLLLAALTATDACLRRDARHFTVLLPGLGLSSAHAWADRLLRRFASQAIELADEVIHVNVSVGVASCPHTADDQPSLLAAADEARVHAAGRGGNQIGLAGIRFEA